MPLPALEFKHFEVFGIKYRVVFNQISTNQLIIDSYFCQQSLFEIGIEFEGIYNLFFKLVLKQRNGKLVSILKKILGQPTFEKQGLATFEEIKPIIEKEIFIIAERRKKMKK